MRYPGLGAARHRFEGGCEGDDPQLNPVDAALEQQIPDLAERKRVADIHHHREGNDLG